MADRTKIVATVGDYHAVILNPESEALIIEFLDAGCKPGEIAVERKHDGSANRIVLNCPNGDWYQYGVPGLADSFDVLLCWLREVIACFDASNVTITGQGMGGRPALLVGVLIDAINVLAINPQLVLGEPGTASQDARRHPWWGHADRISPLGRGRRRVVSLYSAWDAEVGFLASRPQAAQPEFGLSVGFPCKDNLLAHLKRTKLYPALLGRDVDMVKILNDHKIRTTPGYWGTSGQFQIFHAATIASEQSAGLDRMLEFVGQEEHWKNPGWQALRSSVLRRAGKPEAAIEAGERAARIGPGVQAFCVAYARAAVAGKDVEAARRANDLLDPFATRRGVAELREGLVAVSEL